jgi:hypothetical protein
MAKGKKEGPTKKEVEKKVNKVVEDKTFGLKNKNKSKKVQQYVQQVQNVARAAKSGGEVRTADWYAAQEAKRKKEKEEKKQLEKEMLALLGKEYGGMTAKQKKKDEEDKKKEEEKKRAEMAAQYEHDFSVPITTLDQVFRVDGKATVTRVCGELVFKDNLVSRTKDGTKECVYCKLADGSTRLPLPVTLIGWTPSTCNVKQGAVVDIRDAVAMVRGDVVDLEVINGVGTVVEASPSLAEHILSMKREAEELRERGGIPIEELIEEQRAKLKSSELTPLTAERFLEWKAKKLKIKQDAKDKERQELEAKHAKSGANVLSGRALFAYDPTLFKDDDAAEDKYEVPEDQQQSSGGEEEEEDGESGESEEEEDGEEEKQQQQNDEDDAGDEENPIEEEPDVDLDDLEDDE